MIECLIKKYIYVCISINKLPEANVPLRALEERLQKRMYFLLGCFWHSAASCERGCQNKAKFEDVCENTRFLVVVSLIVQIHENVWELMKLS